MKLGFQAKAYILSTGTRATWGAADENGVHEGAAPGALTEMTLLKDVEIPWEADRADVSTRGSNGFKLAAAALIGAAIELPSMYDTEDDAYQAMMGALINRTSVAIALLDGDKAEGGAEGLWADFAVLKATKGEKLNEAQMVTFTIEPTLSAVAPERVRVSGS